MKWHHLYTLFYKITIVHIKPESQLILQIEESFTHLWLVLGELTVFHTVDIGYSDIGYSDILDIVILLSLGMNPRLHETHT